jgi:MFS transporter, SP family, solute carrier family 2 (myo-inositol transporter), member 13
MLWLTSYQNSLMYFSATIFTMLGFPIPTLTSLVVAVTNFAFTLVALVYVDRVGRRRILLWSIPLMIVGLLLAGYGFSFIELSSASAPPTAHGAAVIILVSIMLYVAGYAVGLGNVPWMQSELFALNVRSLGSGVATATNWGANFIIGLTFLLLMDTLTPTWTFVLYAGICAAGYGLIWGFYPETAGLSLEEAATLLEDDNWGLC